jgi:uncharacterized protein YkwD
MSPRHHLNLLCPLRALLTPLRTLLPPLLVSALFLFAATASAGAAGQRGSHRRAHHACRIAHTRRHHARGCTSRAHRHKGSRRHKGPHSSAAAARNSATNPAVIAGILATPCQNTEVTPEAGNLQAVTAATLCLVNQERARHGEMPVQVNADLEAAADSHSREMVSLDYFGHVAPNGLTPLGRVEDTGYIPSPQDGYTIGENIAWGTLQLSTPKAIVTAWIASPEHLANILEAHYRDTAIGVYPEAPASLSSEEDGAVYTQEFGVITG